MACSVPLSAKTTTSTGLTSTNQVNQTYAPTYMDSELVYTHVRMHYIYALSHTCTYVCTYIRIYTYVRTYIHTYIVSITLSRSIASIMILNTSKHMGISWN